MAQDKPVAKPDLERTTSKSPAQLSFERMPGSRETKDSQKNTKPAGHEVTGHTPRAAADRKGVVGYLSESEVTDLTAIAAAQNSSLTRYVSKLLAEHVAANPDLVEKGMPIIEGGRRVPYRTRRQELEEEVVQLRTQLISVNPS